MTASDASAAPTRYRLKFLPEAMAEWNALDGSVKAILKKLLLKRLEQPRTPGAELRGDLRDCYKIKLATTWPTSTIDSTLETTGASLVMTTRMAITTATTLALSSRSCS